MQTELVSLNLSQNNLSDGSSRTVQSLLITNETIISLNLSSYQGNEANRFGKEFSRAIAKCLKLNECLLSKLNLAGVNMTCEDLQLIADSLSVYERLEDVDLSNNRLYGANAGTVIA